MIDYYKRKDQEMINAALEILGMEKGIVALLNRGFNEDDIVIESAKIMHRQSGNIKFLSR